MNVAVENKIDELTRALHNVTVMQEQNQTAQYRLERKEQSWEEINRYGSRLFDRLLSCWHEDRQMGLLFEDNKQEFWRFQQQNKYALEEEKEQLMADKRVLVDKEEAYYYERRKLMMDGEL
ncbi:DUF3958 family protein [Listeria welshimeri]|uniref:DUF3958 family protein n=1 Tax=Listeria welshimeri TaxID=1643 RepID=UPI001888F13C|nr:DUF3958 family protein [Listeria welshimeri]MBF2456557.1 DUF3958 family protein [Listeria welshimeri]MBF2568392.1 DUF3958 family protein [Listeria welshimeri]